MLHLSATRCAGAIEIIRITYKRLKPEATDVFAALRTLEAKLDPDLLDDTATDQPTIDPNQDALISREEAGG